MLNVCRKRGAVDEDFVEKDSRELPQKRPEKAVHGGLEGRGCIGQTEGYHLEFIVTMMGAERRFWDVIFVHSNLMEPLMEIQLRKPRGVSNLIQ